MEKIKFILVNKVSHEDEEVLVDSDEVMFDCAAGYALRASETVEGGAYLKNGIVGICPYTVVMFRLKRSKKSVEKTNEGDVMGKDEYEVPVGLMRTVMETYNDGLPFELDAAATKENAKGQRYFDVTQNGLAQKWFGTVWCFPPFSEMRRFCDKAAISVLHQHADKVVMLLQARFGSHWFQLFMESLEDNNIPHTLTMIGHVRFAGQQNQSQYDMLIVALGKDCDERPLRAGRVRRIHFAQRGRQ